MHQADLTYLPLDKVYQNTYKYTLQVIDVASRYKVSRPLKTKRASEVADMMKDVYKRGPLKYPQELHVYNGTEFKADVLKLMKEHDVKVVSAAPSRSGVFELLYLSQHQNDHDVFVDLEAASQKYDRESS